MAFVESSQELSAFCRRPSKKHMSGRKTPLKHSKMLPISQHLPSSAISKSALAFIHNATELSPPSCLRSATREPSWWVGPSEQHGIRSSHLKPPCPKQHVSAGLKRTMSLPGVGYGMNFDPLAVETSWNRPSLVCGSGAGESCVS